MRMRWFLIATTVLVVLALKSYSFPPAVKAMMEAEDKLREFVPTLATFEDKFSNDPQLLLGLATIYERYGLRSGHQDRSERLYRKILDMEPDNKAARLSLVTSVVGGWGSQRARVLMRFDAKQEYATRENLQEVEIPPWGWGDPDNLYDWLHEEGQEKVVIRDFNEARARLCEKLDRDLPAAISELEKAEKLEPDNATYNYRRAQLNFELGKDAEGLIDMERGTEKPYLSNYWVPITDALKRVFQEAGFPERYWESILYKYRQVGGGPSIRKVFELAKQQEASQNFEKATEIYEAVIRLANQIREEHFPGEAGQAAGKRGDNEYSKHIERQSKQQLAKIQGRVEKPVAVVAKPSVKRAPIWSWPSFFLGAVVAGVVFAGLVLLTKKKASSRGK